jgi:hypothetical protein
MNEADSCVYYRYGGAEAIMLCLYVDDILIFGSNLNVIEEVKKLLSTNFDMKDLREADVILNIKLIREGDGGVTLLQSHYVEKVLSRFGFSDCNCRVPKQGVPTINDQEKQTPKKTTAKALPTKMERAKITNKMPRPHFDSHEACSMKCLDHREISDSHDPGSSRSTHLTHQL